MNFSHSPRVHTRRNPLGDVTRRVNNSHYESPSPPDKESGLLPYHESITIGQVLPTSDSARSHPIQLKARPQGSHNPAGSPGSNAANPRLSAISKDYQVSNSNRNSQISTTSTNGSDGRRRKTHIGPWHLGKTLGKGATARVRMARHAVTGQPAAIKIVQKKNAQLSQAGSLAALDLKDASLNTPGDGARRMPYGIEREVAIMKLIEHPHIMKLYDIWENRTEIYLVLEYIDNGELFEHISRHGWLGEEEALRYFRQLLSAVGYCHSFNICHRDLKPENILLTKDLQIKVADFGMAALHQTPEHRLQTSCGSPHYAAPEVIRAAFYRGDKADIWSMGVILFASLAGYLPFDHEDLPGLLEVIKKGRFKIPSKIGSDAADLINRMLQLNPRDRLSISQMWRHPLLRKYDYLDDYGGGLNPRSPEIWAPELRLLRKSDIDRELLRHLRSMWHTFEEQEIIKLLLNNEPNDQKLFYDLLVKHRDAQLENYVPDIGHSTSDYHHAKPLAQLQKLSTRQFSQPNPKGYGRAVSRFTVVSNVSRGRHSNYAETEVAETVQSYDPFRASRPHNLLGVGETAQTNVIVHRGRSMVQDMGPTARSSRNSVSTSIASRTRQRKLAPPRVFASRSSLASSTRSRGSNLGMRVALTHKRGVSFSHVRKFSESSQMKTPAVRLNPDHQGVDISSINSGAVGNGETLPAMVPSPPHPARYIRSRKSTTSPSQVVFPAQKDRTSRLWNEDVRKLSSSLAKTCDEAFNRTSVASTVPTKVSALEDSRSDIYESPLSSFNKSEIYRESSPIEQSHLQVPTVQKRGDRPLDMRPLPKPPARSESVNQELSEARKKVQLRKLSGEDSPRYLDRMVTHIDHLMQPGSSPGPQRTDRRTSSAPVPSKVHETGRLLPSIHESNKEGTGSDRSSEIGNFLHPKRAKVTTANRNGSAPEPRIRRRTLHHEADNRVPRRDDRSKGAIRVVPQSLLSPAKPPAPLNIQKKSSQGPSMSGGSGKAGKKERPPVFDLRQQYMAGSGTDSSPLSSINEYARVEDPFADQSMTGTVRKRPNWFKRTSKYAEDDKVRSVSDKAAPFTPLSTTEGHGRHFNGGDPLVPAKKKSFGFGRFFGKRSMRQEVVPPLAGFAIHDDSASIAESIDEEMRQDNPQSSRTRQIEPQQNWLARLFHVKPAARFICLCVSKRRARQEIAGLLKEWRKYGAKDIVVDKQRNIVFGKVGHRNYFEMKEVAFAAEVLTVIEHGKRSHLSIARFTQEKGAASSFYKVVETLEIILKSRGMLVSDERKKRMIIKTLNAV